MSTMCDWALYYTSQGLSIIPVSGKVPLIQWKPYQERCASEEEIKSWWTKWPEADIGMVCGALFNRFVIDIDGEEGRNSISTISLPPTLTIQTKRGVQLHFKYPRSFEGKTTLAGLLRGVDTRGNGGYAKLPPSTFSDLSGRYSWVSAATMDVADCPKSIIELLEAASKPKVIDKEAGESWLSNILTNIKEGNRNESFTRIAGSLRSRNYSANDIYLFLADKAESVGFDLSELRTVCESVAGYVPRVSTLNTEAQSVEAFLADEQKVEWIVPGLIAKRSINFIHGMPMTAKSWIAFDLAITMAKGGGLWLGKFPTNAGKVLLIEAERFRGETQRRIKGLLSGHSLVVQNVSDAMYVKTGSTTRLNLPQSLDALKQLLAKEKPVLVIWDSFATAHTVGETDRMSIQAVLENIKSLRDEFGCAFFFVNHDTKMSLQHQPGESKQPSMSDMQGNIAVAAVAEMMLSVKRKDDETCMVYNVKNTLNSAIEPFSVSIIDVDSGIKVEAK